MNQDNLLGTFFIVFLLSMGALILGALIYDHNRQEDAKAQAKVMRCNHIGALHAMRNIGVFECGDTIVLKRIEENEHDN
jgi:hypothetical protein